MTHSGREGGGKSGALDFNCTKETRTARRVTERRETRSLDVKDLPSFSPTNHYLGQVETHEKTAIGQGSENAVEDRVARVEQKIKESEAKLN